MDLKHHLSSPLTSDSQTLLVVAHHLERMPRPSSVTTEPYCFAFVPGLMVPSQNNDRQCP
jgi:hypothetical protein